jgi:hypothetical protein
VNPPCVTAICRTAGFFGTHAAADALNGCSQNITQQIIDAAGGLDVCGVTLTTTDLTAVSAVEAICVSPQGSQRLQLVRQLTTTSLNCVLSTVGDDATCAAGNDQCDGVTSINAVFDACNAFCAANTTSEFGACIDALDCFNNGGTLNASGECITGTCFDGTTDTGVPCGPEVSCPTGQECHELPSCHTADLPACVLTENGDCPDPGPAGSTSLCKQARKDLITVVTP